MNNRRLWARICAQRGTSLCRRLGRTLLVLLVVGVWWVGGDMHTASAHALLIRSNPPANAQLAQSPTQIDLWFSESIEPHFSSVRLLDTKGATIPIGTPILDPADHKHLTVPLDNLAPGIYTVAWQNLSQVDGHEWFGSFPITVLNADGSRPLGSPLGSAAVTGSQGRNDLPTPAEAVARWLTLAGMALLFGALVFRQIEIAPGAIKNEPDIAPVNRDISSPVTRAIQELVLNVVRLGALAVAAGTIFQVAAQAYQLHSLGRLPDLLLTTQTGGLALARLGLTLAALLIGLTLHRPDRSTPQTVWMTCAAANALLGVLLIAAAVRGQALWTLPAFAIMVAATGLTAWVSRHRNRRAERISWAGLAVTAGCALLTYPLGSHAAAGAGSVWAVLGDAIHLYAACIWIGGLVLLARLLWRLRRSSYVGLESELWRVVRRFSYLAVFAVFVLVITGIFRALIELPRLDSLFTTDYGKVLLVKLLLIMVTLAVALLNNRLSHGHGQRLSVETRLTRLRRRVAVESVLSWGIMLSVAVLIQTPTPRSLAANAQTLQPKLPFNTIVRAADLSIHLQVAPNQVGDNLFWVHLFHADGSSPGTVQLVRLLFDYQKQRLGQSRIDLQAQGQNTFTTEGAYLSQAGPWKLSVYIRRRGMDDILAPIDLDTPPAPTLTPVTSLWQNPAPVLPTAILLGATLAALGAAPWIWRPLLRRVLRRHYPLVAWAGVAVIGIGVFAMLMAALLWFGENYATVSPAPIYDHLFTAERHRVR